MFVTKLLVPDEDVKIDFFGSPLCINKRKEFGYFRAYKSSKANLVFRNDSGVLMSLALFLERTDTFVDIGANVGLYSSVLCRLLALYPEMKFYAFEANPDTVTRLRQSLEKIDCKIFDFALSNRESELEFIEGPVSSVFGARVNMDSLQITKKPNRIMARTLDSIGIEGDSIVLKIDVEGHEREVLEGCAQLFRAGRIKAVYLDGYRDKCIPDFLLSRGFRWFEGQTLKPSKAVAPEYCLLAINEEWLRLKS
jgi:FkbM family methyltransferase